MVDITKDEFWENRYQEVSKREKENSKIKKIILKHKIITMLLIGLGILMTVNIVYIYKFFEILSSM